MMVRRRLVVAMTCVGLAGLSCQLTAVPAPLPAAQDGLPAVSAGPPSAESAVIAAPEVAEDPKAAAVHRILAELQRRHTGLSGRELELLAWTIVEQAEIYEFEPDLVLAVIKVESAGFHLAVSHVGAMGLMQLLPGTGEEMAQKLGLAWHGPDSLFDPILNVKLGTAYLRELTNRYDSMPTGLAAYNWGPGRIDRRIRRGASVPSRYIEQVMKAYGVPESGRS
jgi:soluble lytic murein transglycosylase